MKLLQTIHAEARRVGPALAILLLNACAVAGPAPAADPPRGAPRDTAARAPAREAPVVRLGVVLPQGGSLQPYATAILEGVRVAAAEHERTGAHRVELEVRPASTAAEVSGAVRELASAGVVAIIGPLIDENVIAAARARPDPGLVLISPTGTQDPAQPNAYALNVSDTLGAGALAAYAVRAGGRAGILAARAPDAAAQARAFRNAYQRSTGGAAPVEVTYGSGTTTYAEQVRELREAGVRTLLIAGSESDVRQVLPQLRYYGLDAEVLGSGSWATADGLRRVGLADLEGAVVAVPFLEETAGGGWQRFRDAYEQTYRRSMENAIPALGHDAALLVLGALPSGTVDAGAVRRAVTRPRRVAAATGELVVSATDLARAPLLVRVQDGRLVPLP